MKTRTERLETLTDHFLSKLEKDLEGGSGFVYNHDIENMHKFLLALKESKHIDKIDSEKGTEQ